MNKRLNRIRRHKKIRAKMKGSSSKLRLVVFKSNKHIYAQLIDDLVGKTLVCANDLELSNKKEKKMKISFEVGKLLAKKALEIKKETVVFDRAGYRYEGRVKEIADGAREGGLKF